MPERRNSVCFISGGPPHCPSRRFRVVPYVERLKADGFAAEWRRLPRPAPARLLALLRLRGTSTVILHRVLLPPWQLAVLKRMAGQVVFDFDDALAELENARASKQAKLRGRMEAVKIHADRIIAGNDWLAAGVDGARGELLVLPTPVDTDRFSPMPAAGSTPTVVWSGTSSNLPYLQEVLPAVREVLSRQNGTFRIVCDQPLPLNEPWAEYRRWTPENEVADFATADINLMPLPDNRWTRGKCGYKLLLGMSCGVAGIASAVGINRQIIDHGVNGFLASSHTEWVAALQAVLSDAALRRRCGAAARETVLRDYSLDSLYPRLRDFILKPAPDRAPAHLAAEAVPG